MHPSILLVLVAALHFGGQAGKPSVEARPLKGIKKANVLVARIPNHPSLESIIQTTVELESRREGIQVVNDEEWNRGSTVPDIYARATVLDISDQRRGGVA